MKNLTFNNLIKRAAALMIVGAVCVGTFMGSTVNVKAATKYHAGTEYGGCGPYVTKNPDKVAQAILTVEKNFGEGPCELILGSDGTIHSDGTFQLSRLAEVYGDHAVDVYLACSEVGCFTDYYDLVGDTKVTIAGHNQDGKFSKMYSGAITSTCNELYAEEQIIHAVYGPYGTLAQVKAYAAANGYATDFIGLNKMGVAVVIGKLAKPAPTAHATTVGTSGTAATVKGAATTTTGFDATFYASMYPDVVKVVGSSQKALYNHYVKYGKAEGRYQNLAEYQAAQQKK